MACSAIEFLPHIALELSLTTAEKELRYAASKHAIESITRDEESRRLRTELLLIESDAEELRDQLQNERDTSDRIRQLVDEHLVRAQNAEQLLSNADQDLRTKQHDIDRLQTEVRSLQSTSHNATTILEEKLATARELSTLRPELEYLRAQQAIAEEVRSDKLSLQRQLADAQCEIETARAEAKRAHARRRNTTVEIAQEEQVADLKKELARERRLRANAEEAATQAQADINVDDVRRELAREKKMREKLEQELDVLRENTQIEDVRRDLSKAQKAKHRLQDEVDNLQHELEREKATSGRAANLSTEDATFAELTDELKREREARTLADKDAAKREELLESEKADLEGKLNQCRSKLREKKGELKSVQTELATAREQIDRAEASAKAAADLVATKALVTKTLSTKRNALDDEATLGTPGNGPSMKKSRIKPAAIGDKSSFSITPFLNKTALLNDDDENRSEAEASPITNSQTTKVPLAPAASIKGNRPPKKTQPRGKKTALVPVVEEEEPASVPQEANVEADNADSQPSEKPAARKKQKPRKSLTDFQSFHKDNEPVKQKKRRLGGRGPTLFDEDDGEPLDASKPNFGGHGLFGPAAYAKLASDKKATPGLRNSLARSTLGSAADGSGFQFSPLKRSRKKLDDTLKV